MATLTIPTLDDFVLRWNAAPKAVAFTNAETMQQLEKRGLPMRVLAKDLLGALPCPGGLSFPKEKFRKHSHETNANREVPGLPAGAAA